MVVVGSIEKYMYPGPTDRGLTYVHIEETVDAFICAIDGFFGSVGPHRFLIGQEEAVTYEYLHRMASETFHGKRLPLLRVPAALAFLGAYLLSAAWKLCGQRRFLQPWMVQFAGEHFEFDLSHAKAELGWRPRRDLREDLHRILEFARFHRDLWLEINYRRPW